MRGTPGSAREVVVKEAVPRVAVARVGEVSMVVMWAATREAARTTGRDASGKCHTCLM
jgi:hypothetical protein